MATHVLLHFTGGSAFTLRRTFQAILYGGGATITGIVPCFGSLLSAVWWIVSSTNMIVKGHRVSGARATFATVTAPLLLVVFVCGGYALLIFFALQPALTNARNAAQQAQQKVQQQPFVVTEEETVTDQQSE